MRVMGEGGGHGEGDGEPYQPELNDNLNHSQIKYDLSIRSALVLKMSVFFVMPVCIYALRT